MHTVTLIAQKGGTGKTALAINLAVAAESLGLRRALVDLDVWKHHGPRCNYEKRLGAPADLAHSD